MSRVATTKTYVLMALLDGKKHGYAIMKDVFRSSNGDCIIPIGTLYKTLQDMADSGLIEEVEPLETRSTRTRRCYHIMPAGRDELLDQIQKLQHLVRYAQSRGLLDVAQQNTSAD
jgi:DNA-binding PadR family transcriptional regulator